MGLKLAALAIVAAATVGLLIMPLGTLDVQVTLPRAGSLGPVQVVGDAKSKILLAFYLGAPLVALLVLAGCAWAAWRIVRKHRQAG